LFYYAKKIIYLSLFEAGERTASAGFASLQGEKEELSIHVQVKGVYGEPDGNYPVCLVTDQQKTGIGELAVKAGCGRYEKKFYCDGYGAFVNGLKIAPEEICAVQIMLSGDKRITGEWKPVHSEGEPEISLQPEKTSSPREENSFMKEEEKPDLKAVSIPSDKWEQLKSQYRLIHPFKDEREFISIEPRDFVVLSEPYQKLVNNSFLLHGFYNYRHLILGKDYRIGTDLETCFYLGVPGVFFEREKMVAIMFGFEGFESDGQIEIGKFGYYLRRVEI